MTWRVEPDGYQIFFNRDERRERKPETAPAVRQRNGVRFVAPLDGDHGGTWIAVDDSGLSVCLLNGFPASGAPSADGPREFVSRGSIPLHAVGCGNADRIADALRALDLGRFRPFILVAIEPGGAGLSADWSGRELRCSPAPPRDRPLVSSSFCTEEVRRNRLAVHERIVGDASLGDATERHLAFHTSHVPQAGPYSACMHRDDASTVSFSRIEVDASEVRFHYVPHAPCRGLPAGPLVRIDRRVAGPGSSGGGSAQ